MTADQLAPFAEAAAPTGRFRQLDLQVGCRHLFGIVNGLRLHLVDLGGSGHPILLLHGVTSSWASWLPVASRMTELGHVYALDLRGHGESQWSAEEAYRTLDLAEDVEAVIAGLPSGPVDLVGSSWGGLAVLEVAARGRAAVRNIVAVDIPPSFERRETTAPPRPGVFADHAAVVEWERSRNRFAADDVIETLAVLGTRPGPDGRLYSRYDPFFLSTWLFRTDDLWPRLAGIQQPVLVIRGRDSHILSPDVAERFAAALADGRLVEVPDAGHLVHVDAPEAFSDTVAAFLRHG